MRLIGREYLEKEYDEILYPELAPPLAIRHLKT